MPAVDENIKAMEEEISKPYKVPDLKSTKDAKKFWENQEEQKIQEGKRHYSERHNYKSRLKHSWKSERLFVPDDFILPGKSITEDIDSTFFTMVSGRPIKEKIDTRKYLDDIRKCFITRLKMGFCLDEVLLNKERYLNEKKKLTHVRGNFLSIQRGFETFLEEDHLSSSTLLEAAKEETKKSKSKVNMINGLKEDLKKLSIAVLVAEEQWRNLKMFQKFLFLISPSEWRRVNDPCFGENEEGGNRPDASLFDIFRDMGENEELESKILKFKKDVRTDQTPVLYFENPQNVLNILAELEKNNLRALVYSKELDFPTEKMIAEVNKVKNGFEESQRRLKEEMLHLKASIEEIEKGTKSNEEKLKDLAFGIFRDLIANEEYLSLTSFVEDVYEDVVAANDSDLDLIAMMREIEVNHENILLALDLQPNEVVIQCTREFYREQKREMKEAAEAEKKVHQMEILLKRLSKALAPPKRFVPRRIVSRSLPPEELMFKFEPPKILSKEEKDQLFLFGEAPENVRLHKPLYL